MTQVNQIQIGGHDASYFPVTLDNIMNIEAPNEKRTLFIGAHPDDIEIGCASKIEDLLEKGYSIYYVICTNGEKAQGTTTEERRLESQVAATCIGRTMTLPTPGENLETYLSSVTETYKGEKGIGGVIYLNLPDTELEHQKDLVTRLEEVFKLIKPTLLFTHSEHDEHRDHVAVSTASKAAAHRWIGSVYMYPVYRQYGFLPTSFFPLGEKDMERKSNLLAFCFPSQINSPFLEKVVATARYFCHDSLLQLDGGFHYVEAFETYRQVI